MFNFIENKIEISENCFPLLTSLGSFSDKIKLKQGLLHYFVREKMFMKIWPENSCPLCFSLFLCSCPELVYYIFLNPKQQSDLNEIEKKSKTTHRANLPPPLSFLLPKQITYNQRFKKENKNLHFLYSATYRMEKKSETKKNKINEPRIPEMITLTQGRVTSFKVLIKNVV